jgi:hypothetical protein
MSRDLVSSVLDVLGIAALAAAGFVVTVWLGLVLAGLGLLVLSWRLSRSNT